ncbi:MAG: hypothetical protein E7615_05820 [Ruminococcaceae bacterium]|nr:hypothetical protein [Oscillospiraceae bacterium]
MKKIIFALLSVLLCIYLASCGSEESGNKNETPESTAAEIQNDPTLPEGVDPEDYFKFVTFDLPEGSLREVAVNYMYEQANIEWKPSKTFTYGNKYEHWGFELTYKAGTVYHGLPYTNLSCSIGEFQKFLDEHNGTFYATSTDGYEVMGAHCNSSICHSFQQFTPVVCMTSNQYMPSYKDEFVGKICGNYTVPDGVQLTQHIIEANTPDIMYEAYAQADMGDVIMTKDDVRGVTHDRMVAKKAFVTRGANGKINPNRSYLVTVEQTDTFDETRKDGVNTTWWVDHQYTFTQLYASNYIPVTFEIFETNEGVLPYLTLDKEPNASAVSKGVIDGTVTSNYPVRYVHISLYDGENNLVSRQVQQNNYDVFKVSLKKHSVKLFDGVSAGNYTLVIDAGICRGDAELYRTEFTYNG